MRRRKNAEAAQLRGRALTPASHAYDVSAALTYVKAGTILPHCQQ